MSPPTNLLVCEPIGDGTLLPSNLQKDANNWFNVTPGPNNACTHDAVSVHDGHAVFGHVNWFPVYVTGKIFWEDHGDDDDDYTFNIATDDNALGSFGRRETDQQALVHSEFSSDDVIDPLVDNVPWVDDQLGRFWWKDFKNSVDGNVAASPGDLINGHRVRAIGLYNLDCAFGNGHDGCGVELHPLYITAIEIDDNPRANKWALLAFNNGSQGYAGGDFVGLESNNAANANYNCCDEQYTMYLPPPDNALSGMYPVATSEYVRIAFPSASPIDAVGPGYFVATDTKSSLGMRLDFRLKRPELQNGTGAILMGDITLDWGPHTQTLSTVFASSATLTDPDPPLRRVRAAESSCHIAGASPRPATPDDTPPSADPEVA
jgi:hypothetical protein